MPILKGLGVVVFVFVERRVGLQAVVWIARRERRKGRRVCRCIWVVGTWG